MDLFLKFLLFTLASTWKAGKLHMTTGRNVKVVYNSLIGNNTKKILNALKMSVSSIHLCHWIHTRYGIIHAKLHRNLRHGFAIQINANDVRAPQKSCKQINYRKQTHTEKYLFSSFLPCQYLVLVTIASFTYM